MAERKRCDWAGDGLMRSYHDLEWGVPLHDDRGLFEAVVLDGAQAGLSWSTILNKRASYRAAFENFEPAAVAGFDEARIRTLLENPGIVRNRLKVRSAVRNAGAVLEIQAEFGSLDAYLWRFVDGRTIQNAFRVPEEVPTETPESRAMSRDLKARGFRFVGPTICYALMQAVGMVNDHLTGCFRHAELRG
ncbi:MAG: DNA-3-methyladenine glycosylase I [Gemmatimonadota bacterium]